MSNYILPIAIIAGLYALTRSKPASSVSVVQEKTNFKIALFKSIGVSKVSYDALTKLFSEQQNINLNVVTAIDIRNGALKGSDVLVMGGGSGSQQAKDLGDEGIQKIKNYVKNGGNYIGICGGAYLAMQSTKTYKKLDLVAAKNYGDHWQRGKGICPVKTNDDREIPLHYENGPVFEAVQTQIVKPFKTLAVFKCDFYKKGKQPGQMPGKPAIILGTCGKGRVLLFSPNPVIGGQETYYPELILNGIDYIVNHKKLPEKIIFSEVFG